MYTSLSTSPTCIYRTCPIYLDSKNGAFSHHCQVKMNTTFNNISMSDRVSSSYIRLSKQATAFLDT